jgi:syntaxin 5
MFFVFLFTRKKTNGDHGASSSSSQPFMQQQLVQQDSYMQSRAEALQNVESTIHELSNIFTQLATMVSQQGELAIRLTLFYKSLFHLIHELAVLCLWSSSYHYFE